METEQIVIMDDMDQFATVKPGEPFRLFKWGNIYKGGKKRTVSKDKPFHLPHFKPPIKLGSHREETPAGGFLTGLEVREDGVWAIPELNEQGIKALEQGDFRYHSPEVIWEGGYIEDPDTGNKIEGPLVVGVALTHTPHLGESTALYTYQQEQKIMGEQFETVPVSVFDKFMALFEKKQEQELEPAPEAPEVPEEFALAIKERDDYKAQLEQMQAEREKAEAYAAIAAEFETEEYGAAFKQLGEGEAVARLAKLDADDRGWFIEQFKAMSAQAGTEEVLTKEIGNDAQAFGTFDEAVKAYAAEKDIPYNDAIVPAAQLHPELYAAYQGGK